MKKIIFLLLVTVASYGQTLQNPTFGNVKIKQNTTDNTATKVNVQATDGTVNTISKSDLQDVTIVNTTAELTSGIGNINKLYATRDNNIIYRFNGTIYVPVTSNNITEVSTITELLNYTNKTGLVTVTDLVRGGDFYYVPSGLTNDNGVVFPALGGGFWVRKLEGFVYPEFWGTGTTTSNQFIQAALNYATGKNLTVKLKAKQYNINDVLLISSNTHLQLDDATIIRLNDNVNTSMLRNSGAVYAGSAAIIDQNITVSGGTWEGNGGLQTLYSSGASPSLNVGLEFHNINNVRVKNTKINISRSYGFYFSSVTNVYIDKVNIDNGNIPDLNRDGLHFNGPAKNIFVNDCILRGTDDQIALNADDVPYAYKVNAGGTIENVFVNNILFNDCRKAIRILPATNDIKKVVMTNITGLITGNLLEISTYGLGTGGSIEDFTFSNVSVDVLKNVTETRPLIIFDSAKYGTINFNNVRIKGSHFTSARIGILENADIDYLKIKDFVSIGTDDGAYSDIEISQTGVLKPTIGTFIIEGLNYSSPLKTSALININNLTSSNFQILNSNIGVTAKILNLENSTLGKVFFSNNSNDNSTNGVNLVNTSIQYLQLTGSYFKDINGFALSQDTPSNIVGFKANAYIINNNADVSTSSFVTYENNGVSKSIAVNGIISTATDRFLPKINSSGDLENSSIKEESTFLKSSKSFLMNSGNYLQLGNENTGVLYSIGYEDGNSQLAFRNGRTGQVDLGINNLSRNVFINAIDNGVDKLKVGGTISADPAILSNQVVVKSQLDAADSGNVKLTGNQTVAGIKTLSDYLQFNTDSGLSTAGSFPIIGRGGNHITLSSGGSASSFARLITTSISSNKDFTFPNQSGTFALEGNLPIQLKDFFTDANNTGTIETDLYSYTTLANRLNSTGEKLVAVYSGTFNDATASSQIKVIFGGQTIGDTGALTMSVTGAWIVNCSIMRTGATTARAMVSISTPSASTAAYTKYTSLTGLTFTGTNILKITGTAGGATGGSDDITASYGNILWQPAAL